MPVAIFTILKPILVYMTTHSPAVAPVKTPVAAPASTNSKRMPVKPAREGLTIVCACTGSVGTGLRAVWVKRRGKKRRTSIQK